MDSTSRLKQKIIPDEKYWRFVYYARLTGLDPIAKEKFMKSMLVSLALLMFSGNVFAANGLNCNAEVSMRDDEWTLEQVNGCVDQTADTVTQDQAPGANVLLASDKGDGVIWVPVDGTWECKHRATRGKKECRRRRH